MKADINFYIYAEQRCRNCKHCKSERLKNGITKYGCYANDKQQGLFVLPDNYCHNHRFNVRMTWMQRLWMKVARKLFGKNNVKSA